MERRGYRLIILCLVGALAVETGLLLILRVRENGLEQYFPANRKDPSELTLSEMGYAAYWKRLDMVRPETEMSTKDFDVFVQGQSDPIMKEIRLTNKGDRILSDFWLFRSDQPNFYSSETLVDSVTKGLDKKTDKVMALWSLFPKYYYNFYPPLTCGLINRPVALLAVFGTAQCDNACDALAVLCEIAGCDSRPVGVGVEEHGTTLFAHRTLEVLADKRWMYLDPDGHVFYRSADNVHIASAAELLANPALVERTRHPVHRTPLVARAFREGTVRIFDSSLADYQSLHHRDEDVDPTRYSEHRHIMRYQLFPGSSIRLSWTREGKFFRYNDPLRAPEPPLYSNSQLMFTLDVDHFNEEAVLGQNVVFNKTSGMLRASRKLRSDPASVVFPVVSSYIIVGGRIRGEIQSDHERPNVYFYPGYKYQLHSLGRKWERIPTLPSRTGTGLSFDAEIDNYCALPMFYYFVKLEVPPAGLQIRRLSFVTERQSAPKALPYLALGGNTFCVYGKRDVDWGNFSVTREKNGDEMRSLVRTDNGLEITFIYQENDEPPPLLKGTGQDVGQDATLRWSFEHPKGEKIVKYHAQVSRRADFRWPLATNFDLETQEDHLVVEGSWLCPGDTYYWRVRAQDAKGNWSAFSAARKFKYPPPSPAP